ncbi:MAG TPA: hypothetical protein VF908_11880 [Gemmatimonadaceae bacterium]
MNKFVAALKLAETAFVLLLTFLPACSVALAQDSSNPLGEKPSEENSKIVYGAESDFTSGSAWRGLVISDRPVVSNAGWISKYGFTFMAANTLALSDTTEGTRPRVTDLILAYKHDWRKLKIEPTLDSYWYHDPLNIGTSTSIEGSIKLSYPAGPIRLFTSHSSDVLSHKGAYFGEAGMKYERNLPERNELGISIDTGWASSTFNQAYDRAFGSSRTDPDSSNPARRRCKE